MANDQVLSLENETTEQQPEEKTPADQIKDALAVLVGEDKKFKDTESLAQGKLAADQFIDHLKQENEGLRQELKMAQEAKASSEVEAMKKSLSQPPAEQPAQEQTPPEVSSEGLEKMIAQQLAERETRASADANVNRTNEALVKLYGDPAKAGEVVKARADALGISIEDVTKMAARSPEAALTLIRGEQGGGQTDISKTSSVSGAAASGGLAEDGTKASFDALRRKDPSKYWSSAVQQQIFQAKKEGKYI